MRHVFPIVLSVFALATALFVGRQWQAGYDSLAIRKLQSELLAEKAKRCPPVNYQMKLVGNLSSDSISLSVSRGGK